jgi:hypothetical protein
MEIEITKQANLILGESNIFWVPTGAVILSAIAAVYVIYLNGKRERRRTTIDLVIATEQDKVYKEKYASISKLIINDVCLVDYARFIDIEHEKLNNIRYVLNRLEFIASGIRNKAFDEKIYKEYNRTNLLKIWKAVAPLVAEIRRRKGVFTYYQEIEWLSNKWENKKVKRINSIKSYLLI